jgi:hypothetical protein
MHRAGRIRAIQNVLADGLPSNNAEPRQQLQFALCRAESTAAKASNATNMKGLIRRTVKERQDGSSSLAKERPAQSIVGGRYHIGNDCNLYDDRGQADWIDGIPRGYRLGHPLRITDSS